MDHARPTANFLLGHGREAPTFMLSGTYVAARRRHTPRMLIRYLDQLAVSCAIPGRSPLRRAVNPGVESPMVSPSYSFCPRGKLRVRQLAGGTA